MEPKFVMRDEFKVIGMEYIGKGENGELPQLWTNFIPRMAEIKNITSPNIAYGVCGSLNEDGSFSYVAGMEVSELNNIPEGMVGLTIPAAKYAVFTQKGSLESLHSIYDYIYKTWLPNSGIELAESPMFELYDERFDNFSEKSEIDIYVAIK